MHDSSDPEMLEQVTEPKQTLKSSAPCLGYKMRALVHWEPHERVLGVFPSCSNRA